MKKEKFFLVNLHSVIDVITNSSTEIFSSATNASIDGIKDLIDTILKMSNSNLTHSDLFEDIILFDTNYASEIELKLLIIEMVKDGVYKPEKDNYKYISKENCDIVTSKSRLKSVNYDECFSVSPYTFIKENINLFKDYTSNSENPCTLLFFPVDSAHEDLCKGLYKIIDIFEAEEFYC